MRTLLLLIVTLIVLSSSAFTGDGWLDLFADADHSTWCVYPPAAQYIPIEVYLFARPPADGFMATECKMVIPDPCASITMEEYHPNMNLALGEWDTGMGLSFNQCMTDPWVLLCHLQIISLDCAWSPDCQVIELQPHDDTGFFGFVSCSSS